MVIQAALTNGDGSVTLRSCLDLVNLGLMVKQLHRMHPGGDRHIVVLACNAGQPWHVLQRDCNGQELAHIAGTGRLQGSSQAAAVASRVKTIKMAMGINKHTWQ